ncbi:MAG: ABC transporter permease [Armatimonadota bacterium]
MKFLRRAWSTAGKEALLVVVLAAVIAAMSAMSPRFLTPYNQLEMTRHFVEIGLIALPMTLVIITGGIDLSVGSILGLSAVVLGYCWRHWHISIWACSAAAICVGAFAGAANGAMVAWARIPPLIVTLATLAIYRGLALGISQAQPVFDYPEAFYLLGQGYVGPMPMQLLIFVLAAAVVGCVLALTKHGRAIYAIGASEEAARLSGTPVSTAKLLLYTFSGLMAGLAAVVYVSRVSTAKADAGLGYELDVISAVVLGGTSVSGGEGSVVGTVLGLLIISSLRNGLTLAGNPAEIQAVIIGSLLIAAVGLDSSLRRLPGGHSASY